jgi:hypothetical protein
MPQEDLQMHLEKVRVMSSSDREGIKRKAKNNKADKDQQSIQTTTNVCYHLSLVKLEFFYPIIKRENYLISIIGYKYSNLFV